MLDGLPEGACSVIVAFDLISKLHGFAKGAQELVGFPELVMVLCEN